MEEDSRPVHEIRMGAVEATIWKSKSESDASYDSAMFCTIYRHPQGGWRRSSTFSRDDLLLLAKVANDVHTYMVLQAVPATEEIDAVE